MEANPKPHKHRNITLMLSKKGAFHHQTESWTLDTNNFSNLMLSSTLLKFDKSKISWKVTNLVCVCVFKKRQLLFVLVFAFPTIIEIWLQLVVATNAKKL